MLGRGRGLRLDVVRSGMRVGTGRLGRRPLLGESADGVQLITTDVHLRGLGLQLEAPLAGLHIEGFVHLHAIDEIDERIALGDHLETGPLAEGRLDVILAAEAYDVLPVGVALGPVQAAAFHGLAGRAGGPHLLFVAVETDFGADRGLEDGAVRELGREDEDVAHAAFDDLGLDAGHPVAAYRALRPEAVHEDTAIAGAGLPLTPGLLAPLELDHEMVVAIGTERGDGPVTFAAHDEITIRSELEDGLRIAGDIELGVDEELGLSLAEELEQVDLLGDGLRDRFRRQDDLSDRLLALRGQSDDGQQREHEGGDGVVFHGVKEEDFKRDPDVPNRPPLFNPFASIERNRSLSEQNRIGRAAIAMAAVRA